MVGAIIGAGLGGFMNTISDIINSSNRNRRLDKGISYLRRSILSEDDIRSEERLNARSAGNASVMTANRAGGQSRNVLNSDVARAQAVAPIAASLIDANRAVRARAGDINRNVYSQIAGLETQKQDADIPGSFIQGGIYGGIAGAQIEKLAGNGTPDSPSTTGEELEQSPLAESLLPIKDPADLETMNLPPFGRYSIGDKTIGSEAPGPDFRGSSRTFTNPEVEVGPVELAKPYVHGSYYSNPAPQMPPPQRTRPTYPSTTGPAYLYNKPSNLGMEYPGGSFWSSFLGPYTGQPSKNSSNGYSFDKNNPRKTIDRDLEKPFKLKWPWELF